MAKNRNWNDHNLPVWFDGKNINQALFCEEFLRTHKILFAEGAFFTSDGRVTGELPLRREIYEELRCCTVNNIPRKIGNIVEILKLAAQVEDFPPQADRIHLSNGTLILDGSIGKISENRFVRADLELSSFAWTMICSGRRCGDQLCKNHPSRRGQELD